MTGAVQPGTIVGGKYRIDRVLGKGGAGVVVLAQHLQLDEPVAIKFLLPEALANRDMVTRFEREARAAVKIKSEHSVRVIDVGSLETGAPYIVMEYLRGSDLRSVLQQRGQLPLEEAAEYLLQACEALAEAHALGIIHRDLKPANLFLARRPDGSACVKVLDFGVSKLTSDQVPGTSQGVTSTHTVMGSPRYMSPEQLVSTRDVDVRTDVWALGVSLFELITGSAPFDGNSVSELAGAIMTAEPVKIRSIRRELPVNLEKLILGCLEKRRDKRIANIAEFARRLSEFAPKNARTSLDRIVRLTHGAGLPASTPAPAPPVTSGPDQTEPLTLTEFSRTGTRSTSGKRWLAGTGTLIAVGAGIFLAARAVSSTSTDASALASSPPSAAMLEAPASVKPVTEQHQGDPIGVAAPSAGAPVSTPAVPASVASTLPPPAPNRTVSQAPAARKPSVETEALPRPSQSARAESAAPAAETRSRPRGALGGRL